jgi:hypothetical protein
LHDFASRRLESTKVKELHPQLQTDEVINNPEELKSRLNNVLLSMNPQASKEEFLDQLILLQELHLLYEKKELSKNMLSAYLVMTEEFQMDLLKHMGSPLASEWNTNGRGVPDVF